MKIFFITENESKFQEAKLIFEEKGIELEKIDLKLDEFQTISQENIVINKAEQAFKVLQRPVITDDTGIFFSDYKNFPGTYTKVLFECIGFEGLKKLMEGTSRKAFFRTLLCYKDKNITKVFSGDWKGEITEEISQKFNPDWQYNSIFVPESFSMPLAEIPIEERAKHSHRKKAIEKLAKYLKTKGEIK